MINHFRVRCGSACIAAALAIAAGTLAATSAEAAEGVYEISSVPAILGTPGCYVVTRNLSISAPATYAIHVTASDVTIDLNGFTLKGDSYSIGSGILQALGADRLTVRNGFITGVGHPVMAERKGNRLEDLTVFDCGDATSLGDGALVRGCVFAGHMLNTGSRKHVLWLDSGGRVEDCLFEGNRSLSDPSVCISTTNGTRIARCVFSGNMEAVGIFGGSLVEECVFYGNNKGSVTNIDQVSVVRNTVIADSWADYYFEGVSLADVVEGCTVCLHDFDSRWTVQSSDFYHNRLVRDCVVYDNNASNLIEYAYDNNASVVGCVACKVHGVGFYASSFLAGSGGRWAYCAASSNSTTAYSLPQTRVLVEKCLAARNGSASFDLLNGMAVLRDDHDAFKSGASGFRVSGTSGEVVRCSIQGMTNFTPPYVMGTLLQPTAGVAIGTTNSWANFKW